MYTCQVSERFIQHGDRRVFGRLYLPEGEGPFPAVILSHGYNGIGDDFDGECRFYAANGHAAFALDFCGGSTRSRSSGKSTDMTLFTEKEDLLAVLDQISALPQVDAAQVYLMGGSQGGLVTALAAAERPDAVRGLILYFPALNIPEDWRHRYPRVEDIPETTDFWGLTLGRNFFASMHDLTPFAVVGRYKGPVLIITGDEDRIVTPACAKRTASSYAHAELVILPGEGHGFTPEGNRTAMERALALMQG